MDLFLCKRFKNSSNIVKDQNKFKDKDKIMVRRVSINLLYATMMKMRIFLMKNPIDNSSSMNLQAA